MRVEHLAIDGAVVSFEAEADLTTQATATGWAIVPSLLRAHPFTIFPAGHSSAVEEIVRNYFPDFKIEAMEEYDLKGGKLRIAPVTMPTATGGTRELSIGAWEGRSGCLTTSMVGSDCARLVEVFDTLQFSERSKGLSIQSPITPRPREPMVIKEIPSIGVLDVRPAIASTLERIPKSQGQMTTHGELFRVRESSSAMMFVTSSAVVRIDPLDNVNTEEAMAVAQELRVEWRPPKGNRG